MRESNLVHAVRLNETDPSFQFTFDSLHPIGSLKIVAFHALRGVDQLTSLAPSPKYGADTFSVLKDVVSFEEYNRLLSCGTISEAWSKHYIPVSSICTMCGETRSIRRYVIRDGSFCGRCAQNYQYRVEYQRWRRGGKHGSTDDKTVPPTSVGHRSVSV